MNPIQILFHVIELASIYALFRTVAGLNVRIGALEKKPKDQPVFKAPQPVQEWQKPIEGFEPKKPETLRPGQVIGREVDEREFEFDVKINKI